MLFQISLSKLNKINVLGVMSGTSCDGFDFALMEMSCNKGEPTYKVLTTEFVEFEPELKFKLTELIYSQEAKFVDISSCSYQFSRALSDGVLELKKLHQIDLIGIHGQTIFHAGERSETWQTGNGQLVSKWTGIPTVSDFRTGDTAFGGEGAPLVSYFDYLYWNQVEKNQLILNIGGISNGTYLPKRVKEIDVTSFDFGPGNTLIDLAMSELFQKEYDENGEIALSGEVNNFILKKWVSEDLYFNKPFPKSSGREYFNKEYLQKLRAECLNLSNEDFLATVTALTVEAVIFQLELFKMTVDEIYITGGGAFNVAILSRFKEKGYNVSKVSIEDIMFKEAIIFGMLAYFFVIGKTGNLPNATGASKKTILGSFSY